MHKFITTEEFVYKGRPCAGIPLLCDSERIPASVTNNYLLYLVFERGSANSPTTWDNYANALLDYFSWLEANGLEWDEEPRQTQKGKEVSNLALYQSWSQRDYKKPDGYPLSTGTINLRTACVQGFYKWARDVAGLIDWLPFITESKAIPQRHPDTFAHTHGQIFVESSTLTLPTKKKLPKLLNLDQCKELMAAPLSRTVKSMTRLMLSSGLRNQECRTFPRKYVFNPSGLDKRKRIRIELDPRDLLLKGNKERVIYVSWQTMASLYDYTRFGEGVERAKLFEEKTRIEPPMLFLNDKGEPWNEKGLNHAYRKLWAGFVRHSKKQPPVISFRVTPHMLRHTFATLELYHEANAVDRNTGRKKGMGHALAWVRDRLGHSSIQTTTIYTHCLDIMDDHELNEYQQELDQMMSGEAHGA
ncbi:MAG: tyrosine-type recombinase/integrase [Pseudomonadota bacterium]